MTQVPLPAKNLGYMTVLVDLSTRWTWLQNATPR